MSLSVDELKEIINRLEEHKNEAEKSFRVRSVRSYPNNSDKFYMGVAAAFRYSIGVIEKILKERGEKK